MKTMRVYGLALTAILVGSALLPSCGGNKPLSTSQGEATVELFIQWPTSRVIPNETQTIKLWVSGPGISDATIRVFNRPDRPSQGGRTVITVPAGPQRLFGAAAFDSSGRCLAFANAILDLAPGERKGITLEMQLTPSRPDEAVGDRIVNPEQVRWLYGLQVIPDPDNPLQAVGILTLSAESEEDVRNITHDRVSIEQVVVGRDINGRNVSAVLRVAPTTFEGGGTTSRKIDIAFVLDTTGSMGDEIAGVRDSVRAFASTLAISGHNIRLGAITFGDEIREVKDFTADVEEFRSFVAGLDAYGGGDDPEIGLDAVLAAHEHLNWRADAEKVIIVITDATAHQRGDGTSFSRVTAEEVINALRGGYTVHVVSSRYPNRSRSYQQNNQSSDTSFSPLTLRGRADTEPYDMKNLAPALGGIWIELPTSGNVDLTRLGITDIIRNTYRFKFLRAKWFNTPTVPTVTVYIKRRENEWVRFPLGLGM